MARIITDQRPTSVPQIMELPKKDGNIVFASTGPYEDSHLMILSVIASICKQEGGTWRPVTLRECVKFTGGFNWPFSLSPRSFAYFDRSLDMEKYIDAAAYWLSQKNWVDYYDHSGYMAVTVCVREELREVLKDCYVYLVQRIQPGE